MKICLECNDFLECADRVKSASADKFVLSAEKKDGGKMLSYYVHSSDL
ncbi:MAG: hypothetical protein LBM09_01590 [Candidatus Nomurabacteria bacterium]|nr:hypothetical protein [Candidatus Nomurabacteria bacterium]